MTPRSVPPDNAAVETLDLTAGEDGSDDDGVLPPMYQVALRLDGAGLSTQEIARELEVEEESVPLLLDLARRKRERHATTEHTKG